MLLLDDSVTQIPPCALFVGWQRLTKSMWHIDTTCFRLKGSNRFKCSSRPSRQQELLTPKKEPSSPFFCSCSFSKDCLLNTSFPRKIYQQKNQTHSINQKHKRLHSAPRTPPSFRPCPSPPPPPPLRRLQPSRREGASWSEGCGCQEHRQLERVGFSTKKARKRWVLIVCRLWFFFFSKSFFNRCS